MLSRAQHLLLSRPCYSTKSVMRDVAAVLKNTPNRNSASSYQKTPRRAAPGSWKPFIPNSVIRPHDFLYQSRRVALPPPRRRPAVGPPPAQASYNDVFHQFDLDPLSQATNPAVLSGFLSEMGKIYPREITGLTLKSQRRLGKAIRRSKMMGIIPVLSTNKPWSGSSKNRR